MYDHVAAGIVSIVLSAAINNQYSGCGGVYSHSIAGIVTVDGALVTGWAFDRGVTCSDAVVGSAGCAGLQSATGASAIIIVVVVAVVTIAVTVLDGLIGR